MFRIRIGNKKVALVKAVLRFAVRAQVKQRQIAERACGTGGRNHLLKGSATTSGSEPPLRRLVQKSQCRPPGPIREPRAGHNVIDIELAQVRQHRFFTADRCPQIRL